MNRRTLGLLQAVLALLGWFPVRGAAQGTCTVLSGGDLGAKIHECQVRLPSTGGVIQLPASDTSTYDNFSTPVTLSKSNVTLRGYGQSYGAATRGPTTLFWTGTADTAAITITGNNVTLDGFVLGKTSNHGTVGIRIAGGADFTTLNNISVRPSIRFAFAGLQTQPQGDRATWILLRHCWFQDVADSVGVDIDNANLFVSEMSTFIDNRINIRVGRTARVYSFYFLSGSDAQIGDVAGDGAVNLDLVNVENAVIRDSYFETAQDAHPGVERQLTLRVGPGASNVLFEGNYVQGTRHSRHAIDIATTSPVTILSNSFNNYSVSAIRAGEGIDLQPSNNQLMGITPAAALTSVPTDLSGVRPAGNPSNAPALSRELTTSSFVLSPEWGAGSSVTSVSGSEQGFQVIVTAGSGTRSRPRLTLATSGGTARPIVVCGQGGEGTGNSAQVLAAATASGLTITFDGTPRPRRTFVFSCVTTS